jgi:lysophospholipase L1-like esterase
MPSCVHHLRLCSVPVLLLFTGCSTHAHTASLTLSPPKIEAQRSLNRIMPMGDSITRGSGYGNYRRPLQFLLAKGGYHAQIVGTNQEQSLSYHGTDPWQNFSPYQPGHEGYGSQRIDQLAGNSPATDDGGFVYPGLEHAFAVDKPHVVLMMLGTNDVLQSYDPGGPGYGGKTGFAADAAERLDQLVSHLFQISPHLKLVLVTLTPLQDPAKEAMVTAFNDDIPQIIAAHKRLGQDIVPAPMHSALSLSDLSPDGIHPRTLGYDKMARVWYQALTGRTAPPLPQNAVSPYGPGRLGQKNVFAPSDKVAVSNVFAPGMPGHNLVDGTNHAFVFSNIADERVSISGFHSAIQCLRFFDTPSYTGRIPGNVTVYYSASVQTSLDPKDYTRLGSFTLPTTGVFPPPSVGDIYENETNPAAHPASSDVKSQRTAVIDFDDLDHLSIPAGTQSLLLEFSKTMGYGDGLTEIQAFPPL